MKIGLAAAAALSLFAAAAPAAAGTVNFNNTPGGSYADGFVATGEPGVTFSTAFGSGLNVGSYFESNFSPALAVFSDTPNYLIGDFSALQGSMSLDFGNDQAGFLFPGDGALLRLFRNGNEVGSTFLAANLDDMMNQTISFSGATFDRFTFAYVNSARNPVGLIEVVDNINFTAAGGVPEPTTWALMILGMGAIGGAMRRRSATKTTVRFA